MIKVRGVSMAPTLSSGDYLLTLRPRTLRAGLIYVIDHERHGKIIKRIKRVEENTAYYHSDNPEGSSGQVKTEQVLRRAAFAITPKGIKRL